MDKAPATGDFCWTELATPNLKAAKEFYADAFGWQFTEHKMDDKSYTMIKNGEQEFGGIWEITKDQSDVPPHWMSYILVADLKQSIEKVKKLGASIKVPLTKAGDFGLFAVIVDPTGAHIALWESLQSC